MLDALPFAPTLVVSTGNGIHGWWIWKEPWRFSAPDARDEARRLARAWQLLVEAAARNLGHVGIDRVHDLERIMRVPGTLNHKDPADPKPVTILRDGGPSVDPSNVADLPELAPHLAQATEDPAQAGTNASVDLNAEFPSELHDPLLAANVAYKAAWEGRDGDARSQSEREFALAVALARTVARAREVTGTADPEALAQRGLDLAQRAVESEDATAFVFGNDDVLGTLALVSRRDPATWAQVKQRLKGRLDLDDLQRAVRSHPLRLVGDEERASRIQRLVESDGGYSKQSRVEGGLEEERVSNFTLQLRERLTMPGGQEVLTVDLVPSEGVARPVNLHHSALQSSQRLLDALGTTEAVWLGNDRDVQLLRAHLLRREVPRARGVETIGRHGE